MYLSFAHCLRSKMVVPLPNWIFITLLMVLYRILRRPDGTFNRDLAEFHERKIEAYYDPVNGVFSFDQILERSGEVRCRVYGMAKAGSQRRIPDPYKVLLDDLIVPVVVFFHGGSFVHSSNNTRCYDHFCRNLVRYCNIIVVSVNYHRAPEHRCPRAYEDCLSALRWVHSMSWLRSGKDLKAHIYLMGDSNGGNIAHHVAVRAAEAGMEVRGNIVVNGMFGGMERTDAELMLDAKYYVTIDDRDWYWRAFLPLDADRNHWACNPCGSLKAKDDLKRIVFPRSLVVVAELDLLSDWQLRYSEGLKKAEKDVEVLVLEGATVGFYMLPNNPHFFRLMDAVNGFVRPQSE